MNFQNMEYFLAAAEEGNITRAAQKLNISQQALSNSVARLEAELGECGPGQMAYLRIRYTDETGETKPMEKHVVQISAENAILMGTANASCSFEGNFAQSRVPVYFGEAQAVVLAGQAGTITVTASDGERSAQAQIHIR